MNNLVSFSPLFRQTIGFDRFNDLFENLVNQTEDRFEAYPPYNIEKTGDDTYRITLAVAGFTERDIDITAQDDRLTISGKILQSENEAKPHYLHRGIAARSFERVFRLADHIKVQEASMKDGLLTLDLIREVPEEKKPRMIPINGQTSESGKSLLGKKKS
ncbi:MAG: Hsp20 family protein [Alphaproteobacteria bacterium]|nr:Hsp20 family protein [Alphaproteobacteria bacterium]